MQTFQDDEEGKAGAESDYIANKCTQCVLLELPSEMRVRRREEKHGKK
jgi:hypothetical protein